MKSGWDSPRVAGRLLQTGLKAYCCGWLLGRLVSQLVRPYFERTVIRP